MLMISRVLNQDIEDFDNKDDEIYGLVTGDVQSSDGHSSRTLSLPPIVGCIFNLICPEPNEWLYDYEMHNMKRNDSLWQRLLASSNNDSFYINNLWTSFATQGENDLEKKNKFLREKVDFAAPIVDKRIEC